MVGGNGISFLQAVIIGAISIFASTGFWSYIQLRFNRKSDHNKMVLGLGHDRLMHLGMVYIERGWITEEEYENYSLWLYEPYEKLKGNGPVKRIKAEVDKLPIRKSWISPLVTEPSPKVS